MPYYMEFLELFIILYTLYIVCMFVYMYMCVYTYTYITLVFL